MLFRSYSDKQLTSVIPAIQKVAMSRKTRNYLKDNSSLIFDLRKKLGELAPSAEIAPIQFQRINWKNVLLALSSVVALYVLVPQFSQVNFKELLTQAQWQWAGVALIGSTLTYFASTSLLLAFIVNKVNWFRTLQAQVAASFATLVTPPTLGSVAVNIRFLNKSGISTASSASAVGVSQVVIFFVHIFLLLTTGVIAGTQTELSFRPPRFTLVIFVVIFAIVLLALSIAQIRNWVLKKARPILSQVGPTISIIFQQPKRLIVSLISASALNLFYILAFFASLKAFGAELTLAKIGRAHV